MKQSEFKSHKLYAESMKALDGRPEYWSGYILGLMRQFHRSDSDAANKEDQFANIPQSDLQRIETNQGYWDGFTAIVISQHHCFRCSKN